jgi:hypothetical protein
LANNSKYSARNCGLVLAILIMTAVSSAGFAFSQSQQLTITTDKTSYSAGDAIMITGTIPVDGGPGPLVIQIFDPENTAILTNVPEPDSDGKYVVELAIVDWEISGTYVVHATYAESDQEATFEFTGLDSQSPKENLVVTFSDGTSRNIDAKATNAVITQIMAVEESYTLVFSLEAGAEDGEFTVVLPREMIDSKFEPEEAGAAEDNNFLVLVDGDYADYNETGSTATDRTLKISLPARTEEVMIGGSSLVPEFPQTVAVIASMIGTVIAVTRFKRLI